MPRSISARAVLARPTLTNSDRAGRSTRHAGPRSAHLLNVRREVAVRSAGCATVPHGPSLCLEPQPEVISGPPSELPATRWGIRLRLSR